MVQMSAENYYNLNEEEFSDDIMEDYGFLYLIKLLIPIVMMKQIQRRLSPPWFLSNIRRVRPQSKPRTASLS